jgi:tetratricopeptide (TPR) repeat protein
MLIKRAVLSAARYSACPTRRPVSSSVLNGTGLYTQGVMLSGGSPLIRAALAQAFGAAGKREKAISILNDLAGLAKQKYIAAYSFAGIHAGLGEDDRALEYLEKSLEEHSHWPIYLHLDPGMDSLRSNPRFQELVRVVGLPSKLAIPA